MFLLPYGLLLVYTLPAGIGVFKQFRADSDSGGDHTMALRLETVVFALCIICPVLFFSSPKTMIAFALAMPIVSITTAILATRIGGAGSNLVGFASLAYFLACIAVLAFLVHSFLTTPMRGF